MVEHKFGKDFKAIFLSILIQPKKHILSYQKIISDVKGGNFLPVYCLHGVEPFFIDKITEAIIEHALDEPERAFNEIILYGKEIDHLMVADHARQFPMMAQRRLVVVKEAQEMRTLKDLESYVNNPSTQTVLVIAHKHKKLDMRTKFGKTLKAKALVFESKKLYDNQVPQWISSYLQDKKLSIAPDASFLLTEYLGSDLSRITTELDKLIINLKGENSVNKGHIQKYVGISKEYNVFELQNAIGKGDVQKAHRIVNYFHENPKNNPLVLVLGNLYGYFCKLALVKENIKLSDHAMTSVLGLSPRAVGFVKDYKSAAHNFSMDHLHRIFQMLAESDRKSKGVGARNHSAKAILQELLATVFS